MRVRCVTCNSLSTSHAGSLPVLTIRIADILNSKGRLQYGIHTDCRDQLLLYKLRSHTKYRNRVSLGHMVAYLVEALCYKPEGRRFDSHVHCCGRTVALASTQPLTEMSTRDLLWGVKAAGA